MNTLSRNTKARRCSYDADRLVALIQHRYRCPPMRLAASRIDLSGERHAGFSVMISRTLHCRLLRLGAIHPSILSGRQDQPCVTEPVAIRTDRLTILWFLWTLGALAFWRVALFVALVGFGFFVLIGATGLLLAFEPLPWFRFSALIWAPSAVGFALGGIIGQMKEIRCPSLTFVDRLEHLAA